MVDENWYRGYVLRLDGEWEWGVFPSSYVKIRMYVKQYRVVDYNYLHVVARYLDPDFQAATPGYFPARDGTNLRLPSEMVDVEGTVTDIRLDESEPTPPLPAFNHKTPPSYLKCDIADQGSSFVSVTFTPDQLVIPGDAVHVHVKLLCLTHDPRLRIASVSLRVVVPDSEVRSVEPQKLLIGEGVVVVHRTDRANRDRAAEVRLGTARRETTRTEETITQRSGEEAISCDIRGDVDRNNAVWSIKANGTQGIRGSVEQLSLTLWRPPREILCICSVSAMMDDGSMITRHVRSGARSWIRGIGMGPWLSLWRLFGP